MEQLLYIFCTTIPSHIIAFTLFWDFKWRSRKAAFILACTNVICKMICANYFILNNMNFRNTELIFSIIGFIIYGLFLCLNPFKMVFTFILIVDYLMIIRGISSFTVVKFFDLSSQSWQSSLLCIILYILTLPILIKFFKQVANQVYNTNAPKLWRVIWIIPALLTALTIIFTNGYLENSIQSYFFIFCRISLLICVFVIYHVLLQALDSLQKQIILEQQLIFEKYMMEMQIDEQKKQNNIIMQSAEQIKRQKHDLHHKLTVIKSLTDSQELNNYIDTLIKQIPTTIKNYCENSAVNAIISHYMSICDKENIDFEVKLIVPKDNKNITDSDLCVIFGNLLENAVEACQRMTEGYKFIKLKSSLHYDILTITMDNSFNGIIKKEKDKFYSSKRNSFGIGLYSIQTVASKTQGNVNFNYNKNLFFSSVCIKLYDH